MARPYTWRIIDSKAEYGGKERSTIAVPVMYGIKHGDDWVNSMIVDVFNGHRKYHKMFYANKTSAQTQCDKLNERFDCYEYRVVRLDENYQ
tara:strand:- start:191 stop:463 length:273 start_codon:yes stop_codon:yes gene_type:complete